jgi:hypothetical protein
MANASSKVERRSMEGLRVQGWGASVVVNDGAQSERGEAGGLQSLPG